MRAESVLMQHVLTNPGDVEKSKASFKKQTDGNLIGGVKHGPAGAALPSDFEAQIERREGLAVDRLEMQCP